VNWKITILKHNKIIATVRLEDINICIQEVLENFKVIRLQPHHDFHGYHLLENLIKVILEQGR